MRTLKNNWLRAGLGLLTAMLVLGAFFIVKAKQNKNQVGSIELNAKVTTQKVWMEVSKINPLLGNIPSNYKIVQIATSAPPVPASLNDCAQNNSSGQYCAFQLEFDENISAEELEEIIDLDVESAKTLLSATESGHARNPSTP